MFLFGSLLNILPFYYSPDDNDDNILATTIFFNGILSTKNIIIINSVLTKIIN